MFLLSHRVVRELEELLGNMTPDQLADLKDKISQMQEKMRQSLKMRK